MEKILLTSNGFLLNKSKKTRAVIIPTALLEKEFSKNVIKTKKEFLNMGIAQVDFVDFEIDNPKLLKQYHVIYLNGGNPFQLLYWMKKSGGFEILQELSDEETTKVPAFFRN